MLGFFIFVAIFPSELSPYNPTSMSFAPGLGPSAANWLGTTTQGQDILSELIWGARQTLIIAFAAGGLATIVSVIVGVSAAYMGGLVDGVLSLITDVLLVIPIFPLVIVIAAYLRSVGLLVMIIVLGALGWSYGARQLRVQVLSLRRRDFLGAARVRGERSGYIIVAEIIPTMTSLIVASFLGTAVFAVLTAAGLQFLGLGDPNSQSWGNMLYWAQNNEALEAGSPLWAIVPGACIALLGAAFAFLNYAFDEVSNPALRPVRKLSRRSVRRAAASLGDDRDDRQPDAAPARRAPARAQAPARRASLKPRAMGFPTAAGRGATCSRSAICPLRTLPTRDRCWPSKDVDLDLDGGEFLAIVGESGCGKSTLLYAIAQLLNPPAGITGGRCQLLWTRDGNDERQKDAPRKVARALGRHAERNERAQPGDDRGRADARRVQDALGHVEQADRRALGRGPAPRIDRPGPPVELPAPAFGRHAATGDDRDGAPVHAATGDHGRAHLGPRRRGPALTDAPDQGPPATARVCGHLCDPRHLRSFATTRTACW